jgi:hypothetical protein
VLNLIKNLLESFRLLISWSRLRKNCWRSKKINLHYNQLIEQLEQVAEKLSAGSVNFRCQHLFDQLEQGAEKLLAE